MSSYNLDFAPDTFYSATARNPLPVRVAGAIAAHHGYPILNAAYPQNQYTPPPQYISPRPSHRTPRTYDPSYSPSRFVQPSLHNQSYGFPGAPQTTDMSSHSAPSPLARRNSVVDTPSRPCPPISDYSALSGALEAVSLGPSRQRSNSIHKHAALSPYKTYTRPRSNSTAFAMDPDVKPRSSRNRRGSKHIGPCLPDGPADHIRVPQEAYQEPVSITGYQKIDYHRMQPIPFKTERSATPGISMVTVGGEYYPGLEDANAHVFENVVGYREIRVKLLWPGYPMYEKRFKAQADRGMVLMLVANVISNAFRDIISKRIPAKRGFEAWSIGKRPDGSDGIQPNEVIITGLEHRGGAVFQPEVWVPKRRMGIQ